MINVSICTMSIPYCHIHSLALSLSISISFFYFFILFDHCRCRCSCTPQPFLMRSEENFVDKFQIQSKSYLLHICCCWPHYQLFFTLFRFLWLPIFSLISYKSYTIHSVSFAFSLWANMKLPFFEFSSHRFPTQARSHQCTLYSVHCSSFSKWMCSLWNSFLVGGRRNRWHTARHHQHPRMCVPEYEFRILCCCSHVYWALQLTSARYSIRQCAANSSMQRICIVALEWLMAIIATLFRLRHSSYSLCVFRLSFVSSNILSHPARST